MSTSIDGGDITGRRSDPAGRTRRRQAQLLVAVSTVIGLWFGLSAPDLSPVAAAPPVVAAGVPQSQGNGAPAAELPASPPAAVVSPDRVVVPPEVATGGRPLGGRR